MCGFDYRDWLIIRNTRFVSIPWCPGSRSHWTHGWLEQGLLPSGLPLGTHTLGHTLWGTSCTAPLALVCFHVTCRLRLSSPQHAEHSGHRSRAPPLPPAPGRSQDGWSTRLQVHQALSASSPALSSFSCVSAVSLTFFFFFSSPAFSSKGEPRNWPGIQGSFPFLLISSLLSLSSASEKKNPWAKLVKTDLSLQRGRKRDLGRPNNNYFKWAGRRGRFEWILPLL